MNEKERNKNLTGIILTIASKILMVLFFAVIAFGIGWLIDNYNTRLTGETGIIGFGCCGSALLLGAVVILVDLAKISKG